MEVFLRQSINCIVFCILGLCVKNLHIICILTARPCTFNSRFVLFIENYQRVRQGKISGPHNVSIRVYHHYWVSYHRRSRLQKVGQIANNSNGLLLWQLVTANERYISITAHAKLNTVQLNGTRALSLIAWCTSLPPPHESCLQKIRKGFLYTRSFTTSHPSPPPLLLTTKNRCKGSKKNIMKFIKS